jgi:MFS family permease
VVPVVFLIGGLTDGYMESAPDGDPLIVFQLAGWLSQFAWNLWLPALIAIALPLLFPDGHPPSRRWRWVAWLGAAGVLVGMIGQGLAPGMMETRPPVANPFGIDGPFAVLAEIGSIATTIAVVGAGAALIVRLRRSRGVERQQLKWFAYVASLIVAGLSLATLTRLDEDSTWAHIIGPVGWFTALVAAGVGVPVATAFAILRHRLYEIDVVIKRTLVYGALTATLGAAYLASVLLLQFVFSPSSDFAIAASTLAVAALFRPARDRIQALVDRRFYRSSYDAARTVESFGARLRDEVSLEALDAELRAVVRETFQPSHVSLWVRP